jgi:hypothetical protein
MSTAERDVALAYTAGRPGEPRTLLTAKMGMANRGAFLGFLSQVQPKTVISLSWDVGTCHYCPIQTLGTPNLLGT